jgi:hypothetical protein
MGIEQHKTLQTKFYTKGTIGTCHYVNNSLSISKLLSHFIDKGNFHRNVGTYKIGGASSKNALGLFFWGRSLKIHREIKRELFMK